VLFNSWEFLILCVLTLGLYYLPPLTVSKVWQVTVLLPPQWPPRSAQRANSAVASVFSSGCMAIG
jgi:hypothetical protein